eukprot:gene32435-31046_t
MVERDRAHKPAASSSQQGGDLQESEPLREGEMLRKGDLEESTPLRGGEFEDSKSLRGGALEEARLLRVEDLEDSTPLRGGEFEDSNQLRGRELEEARLMRGGALEESVPLKGADLKEPVPLRGALPDSSDAPGAPPSSMARGEESSLKAAVVRHASALINVIWDGGEVCVLLTSLLFSVNSLFVKLLEGQVPVFQIVLCRSLVSLLICSYSVVVANISPVFGQSQHRGLLLLRGLFGAAGMTTFYICLGKLPLADGVTLFFLNPIVTAIAAALIMKERMGWHGLLGVPLSVLGLIVLMHPPFLFGTHQLWGVDRVVGTAFGVVSAFCASGAYLTIRFIGTREPALVMSIYFHVTALATSFIPLCVGIPNYAIMPSWIQAALLFGIGTISFAGQILLSRACQLMLATKVAALNFTQVIFSYILGMLFLHELLHWFGPVGSVMIAAGAVLVTIKNPPPVATMAKSPSKVVSNTGNSASNEGEEGERKGEREEEGARLLPKDGMPNVEQGSKGR